MATRPSPSSRRPGRPGRTRPAARGTARARSQVAEQPRARYTNRMLILLVVFAVLLVSYASSMRAYLDQRRHISDLQAQIASSQKEIGALEKEKKRWKDSAYVEAQARLRFGWVLPGETAYQVLDRNGQPLTRRDRLTDPSTIDPQPPEAWWGRAATSLDAADHPEKYAEPDPGTKLTPQDK